MNKFNKYELKLNGCIEWTGSIDMKGYGVIYFEGIKYKAHRFFYQMAFGKIKNGLFVCHKCDVRNCVNPEHLFLGTARDNCLDAVAKGRWANQKKTHCKYGHEFSETNTLHSGGARNCRTCMRLRQLKRKS